MKNHSGFLSGIVVTIAAITVIGWTWRCNAADVPATDILPYNVQFEVGDAEFLPGDSIAIEEVRGTSELISTGQTYCVRGTYTLASHGEAMLAFYVTVTSGSGVSQVEPAQRVKVVKGSGSFRLTKSMTEPGYPHVTFYPVGSGSGFGGVYFGQGDGVLRNKHFSYRDSEAQPTQSTVHAINNDTNATTSGRAADANRVLLEYLGEPVGAPADLPAAYTKDAMIQAIRTAAVEAGVTLTRIEIEDSEFPFLLGISHEGDFEKFKANLKKTAMYDYPGSVGSHNSSVFTIVPYRAYPPNLAERISHRLMLREQVFFARFTKGS